jgi:hypothetical protein
MFVYSISIELCYNRYNSNLIIVTHLNKRFFYKKKKIERGTSLNLYIRYNLVSYES